MMIKHEVDIITKAMQVLSLHTILIYMFNICDPMPANEALCGKTNSEL